MKLAALAGLLLSASLVTACDLSPQPLPPGSTPTSNGSAGTPGGSSGTSSPGAGMSGPGATGTPGTAADAAAPTGAIMTSNGVDAGASPAVSEAGVASATDASVESTSPPEDAALDGADSADVREEAADATFE
jgi:hypothetical protein